MAMLIAGAGQATLSRTSAQTFNALRTFTNSPDGNNPGPAFIVSGNVLYGTCERGGQYGAGIVFRMNLDGTDFTNLHSFALTASFFTNIGGAYPSGPLLLSDNMLYGPTLYGGSGGYGVIYAVDTGGMNFTNLHNFAFPLNFTNSDGMQPEDRLILIGNTLYGAAANGGVFGDGTLFSICTNGTGFTNFHNFNTAGGYAPQGGITFSSNLLYGAANGGYDSSKVNSGSGTIFAIGTNGMGFTNLYTFSGGSDGGKPQGHLELFGNTLYGTTQEGGNGSIGGTGGDGTIFKINADGTGFVVLHRFSGSDGEDPLGGVILSNNILYGCTAEGGSVNSGVVYKLNLSNTNFVMLHSFTALSGSHETNSDGESPNDHPIIASNLLYGTANSGGLAGDGTVFTLTLPPSPPLGINSSGSNVVLTWPTNAVGFLLQSATNLASPTWGNISAAPVVVNAQNAVTNAVSGKQLLYRLTQ